MEDQIWDQLTNSEKEAWQRIQNTLESAGWKIVSRDLNEQLSAVVNGLLNASNWDSYNYARGLRDGLSMALNVQNRLQLELETAVKQRATDAELRESEVATSDQTEDFS